MEVIDVSKKLYTESSVQAIAAAIRAKNGLSDTYTIAQMAQAIADLPGGITTLKVVTDGILQGTPQVGSNVIVQSSSIGSLVVGDLVAAIAYYNTSTKTFLLTGTVYSISSSSFTMTAQTVYEVFNYVTEDTILKRTYSGAYTNDRINFLGTSAFRDCFDLTSLSLANATRIDPYACSMNGTSTLASISLPKVASIGQYAFEGCVITEAVLPKCRTLSSSAFYNNASLVTVDLKLSSTSSKTIGQNVFDGCTSLTALILRHASTSSTNPIWTLNNVNAFTGTPIASGTGYIYVPDAKKSAYQSNLAWSTFSAQFRSLEDYTLNGDTTSDLDPTKI